MALGLRVITGGSVGIGLAVAGRISPFRPDDTTRSRGPTLVAERGTPAAT